MDSSYNSEASRSTKGKSRDMTPVFDDYILFNSSDSSVSISEVPLFEPAADSDEIMEEAPPVDNNGESSSTGKKKKAKSRAPGASRTDKEKKKDKAFGPEDPFLNNPSCYVSIRPPEPAYPRPRCRPSELFRCAPPISHVTPAFLRSEAAMKAIWNAPPALVTQYVHRPAQDLMGPSPATLRVAEPITPFEALLKRHGARLPKKMKDWFVEPGTGPQSRRHSSSRQRRSSLPTRLLPSVFPHPRSKSAMGRLDAAETMLTLRLSASPSPEPRNSQEPNDDAAETLSGAPSSNGFVDSDEYMGDDE